jgi:predicted nucleic acid-binding protein
VALAYLDSSAIVKTVVREVESAALRRFLRSYDVHASASIARTEVVRAIRRAKPAALTRAYAALERLLLVDLDTELLHAAALLDPPEIRSVDAVHLAAARALAPALAAFVAYDARLADAAAALGLPVEAPG